MRKLPALTFRRGQSKNPLDKLSPPITSTSIRKIRNMVVTELAVCILPRGRPLDSSLEFVSILLPGVEFAFKRLPILNPVAQTLTTEDADFDLRHVEPTSVLWRVVEHHSAKQLGSRALAPNVFEAFPEVGVQVVQYKMNTFPTDAGRSIKFGRLGQNRISCNTPAPATVSNTSIRPRCRLPKS